MFEALSGSLEFKATFDELKTQKAAHEEQVRAVSEALRDKRHEKIKMRGLSDYQKQIEKCVQDQQDTETLLQALALLRSEK